MINKQIKEYREGNKAFREVRVSFCKIPLFYKIEETTNYSIVESLNCEKSKRKSIKGFNYENRNQSKSTN